MRDWIVMLHARSSARLAGEEEVRIDASAESTAPLRAVRLRNAFAEIDGKLVATGVIAEAWGFADEPTDAVATLAPFAAPRLQALATAANAAVAEPDHLLVYAPPEAERPGRFVEQRVANPPLPPAVIRSIMGAQLVEAEQALLDHPDEERLQRAMAHYRLALNALDPFNRVMSAEHLYMAAENLGAVVFRRLCREAGLEVSEDRRQAGENKHTLALAAGFEPQGAGNAHLYAFDSDLRRTHIFGGDGDTYERLRAASDAFEHGYGAFADVQAAAHASADTAFRQLRTAILTELGCAGGPLAAEKFRDPLPGWQPRLEVVGTYSAPASNDWPYFYGADVFPEILAIEDSGGDQRTVTFRANAGGGALLEGQELQVESTTWAVPLTREKNVERVGEPEIVVTRGEREPGGRTE